MSFYDPINQTETKYATHLQPDNTSRNNRSQREVGSRGLEPFPTAPLQERQKKKNRDKNKNKKKKKKEEEEEEEQEEDR